MIEVTYEVRVRMDGNVWSDNYGDGDPLQIIQDVRSQLRDVIQELTGDWIAKSGNAGEVQIVTKEYRTID